MTRLNVTLSSELDEKLNEIAALDSTTKSEIFRKSLQLYLAAKKGSKNGMKLYLFDPKDQNNKTEIIGL
jgi:metal-responsive CopG/Arc/MetJ family transcriptional regulator